MSCSTRPAARAGVFVCADSADSPVGIGRAQGVRDIAEVFAGGLMAEVKERAGREMASERGRGPIRGVGVVIGEWVLKPTRRIESGGCESIVSADTARM